MKTIVAEADDTELGRRVLARAADVAQAFGAHLIVLSVVDVPRDPTAPGLVVPVGVIGGPVGVAPVPIDPLDMEPPPEEVARGRLERAREEHGPRKLDVEYMSDVGDPVGRLLELAEQRSADLIVVGCAERGLLDRLLGPDVGDRVAHRTKRDVLLVH